MFNFWKRKPAEQQPELPKPEPGAPVMAFLLLESPEFNLKDAARHLARQPFAKGLAEPTLKDGNLIFHLGDEMVAVAIMPAPYPWSDLEGPCLTSWMFPDAATILRDHGGHLLVTLLGGQSSPTRRRELLTRITAQLSTEPGVMGIYWAEGTLVHRPDIFREMAEATMGPGVFPMWLWIDFRVNRNRDGSFCLFTTGMAPLGHMEIEIPATHMEPKELREYVTDVAMHLLNVGPVFKDGETVGRTSAERFRIRHTPSMWQRSGPVLTIQIP